MAALHLLVQFGFVYLQITSAQWLHPGLHATATPSQTTEGDTTQLMCTVMTVGPTYQLLPQYIAWVKDNRVLTVNADMIVNDIHSILIYIPEFSHLFINSLKLTDSGYYDCVYFSSDPRFGVSHKISKQTVHVNVAPRNGSIPRTYTCLPDNVNNEVSIRLGETVILVCNSILFVETIGFPIDVLQWTDKDVNELVSASDGQLGGVNPVHAFHPIYLTINAGQAFKSDTFACHAQGTFLSAVCHMTVKVIWPASTVEIHPKELTTKPTDDAQFTCVAFEDFQDTPLSFGIGISSLKVEWRSMPEIETTRWITNGNEARITDISQTDHGTLISCLVFIDYRWLESKAMLYVNDQRTVSSTNASCKPTGWIVAFVILLVASLATIVALGFYNWKLKQTHMSNEVPKPIRPITERQPTYADLGDERTPPEYTGLKKEEYVVMDTSRANSGYAPSPVLTKRNRTDDGLENDEYVQPDNTAEAEISDTRDSIYEVSEPIEEPEYIALE